MPYESIVTPGEMVLSPSELRAEVERLRAALAEADAWIHEATKTITDLTAGGSEYFARRVRDVYRADLPFCAQRIRERFDREREFGRMPLATCAAVSTRDEVAGLVEAMLKEKPWCDQPWARMALTIAARAIRRGRHLTDSERRTNLLNAIRNEANV